MVATLNPAQGKLPPSERDFEVYLFTAIENHSTRAAAAHFGLSQTRIRQILDRVVRFQAEAIPVEAEGLSDEQRLTVSQQAASLRLDHLYCEAMTAWRKSQGETWSIRSGERGDVKITRPAYGEVRFLGAAARITLLAAKVPWRGLTVSFGEGAEEGLGVRDSGLGGAEKNLPEEIAADDTLARSASEGEPVCHHEEPSPPVGDCAEIEVSRDAAAENLPRDARVSAAIARICGERGERRPRGLEELSTPAQSAVQLLENRESNPNRPLSKKERKANRRRLERILAAR